jgi:hypothetical protein
VLPGLIIILPPMRGTQIPSTLSRTCTRTLVAGLVGVGVGVGGSGVSVGVVEGVGVGVVVPDVGVGVCVIVGVGVGVTGGVTK